MEKPRLIVDKKFNKVYISIDYIQVLLMSGTLQASNVIFETQQNKKQQSFTEILKSTITNITYNIKNSQIISLPFFSRKTIEISQKNYSQLHLLGKSYSYVTKKQFLERFASIIWMSYRKYSDQEGDVGWGCMIRVVQMLFGEVFQRYFHQAKTLDIIKLFKDELCGPFSLTQICKLGHIEKRYASAPEIYSVMTSLVQLNRETLNLQISIENFCSTIKIKSQNEYSEEQFPKLITILARGHDKNECEDQQSGNECFSSAYFNHLQSMIRQPSFCGLVGGVNNQALFIVGEYDELAIILDPHYVQLQDKQDTYFQKVPKGIEFTQLKSTFTINFYFENLKQFGEWVDNLILMDKVWKQNRCFDLNVKNPQGWVKNHRKKSEDWEMLD